MVELTPVPVEVIAGEESAFVDITIPAVVFTDPEVARVGINEQEAKERNIAHAVTVYGIDDLDRAIADKVAALAIAAG